MKKLDFRWLDMRWLACVLPPIAFIVIEETPGLSGLNGVNEAALEVLSPFLLAVGIAMTFAIIYLSRWIFRRLRLRSRAAFVVLTLLVVGILSPMDYLDGDWFMLSVTELASLPAALLLAPIAKPTAIRGSLDEV